jgi:YHS domain-containing protein
MKLSISILGAVLLAAPAFAHEGEHQPPAVHAKKGEHQDAPTSFAEKPAKGTWAKCAVSGDIFQVNDKTEIAEHGGRWYAFCCAECKPDFDKEPGKYADKKK